MHIGKQFALNETTQKWCKSKKKLIVSLKKLVVRMSKGLNKKWQSNLTEN